MQGIVCWLYSTKTADKWNTLHQQEKSDVEELGTPEPVEQHYNTNWQYQLPKKVTEVQVYWITLTLS